MNKFEVSWQDQDLANAFIEKGRMHGVQISPDTAMQLALDVRSKAKKNDILELTALLNEETSNLFPSSQEMAVAASIEDVLSVSMKRVDGMILKLAKLILAQEQGITVTPEEADRYRKELMEDVILPMGEVLPDKITNLIEHYMGELIPWKKEYEDIKKYLVSHKKILNNLLDETLANPADAIKKKEYSKARKEHDAKNLRALELERKIAKNSSNIILLSPSNGYVKRNLSIIDQYHGLDGMSRYFENIFKPMVENIKDIMFKIRKGVIVPEVSAKSRHEREWLMRHHHTRSYQESVITPHLDSLDLDTFKKGPVYKELKERNVSDEQISASLDALNAKPMTWRKGNAIYMLLDPPAEKTIHQDLPTLIESVPESWGEQIVTNQPFNIEKGKFEDVDKSKLEKATKPRAMSKERKQSEASNEKAHWSVLFNLSRNQRVDQSGKTRAEKYLESVPENMRDNDEIRKKAEQMDEEDMLHDEDIINAALHNPSTPDWVLMKAATTGYASSIRRVAKAILLRKRGWQLKLDDDKNLTKDEETNDFVWERVPGFSAKASLESTAQTKDQYNMARQSYQDQINSIDEQMKTMTGQMEQLRARKTDLEKQRDSVRAPAAPPAQTTAPAPASPVPAGSPPMAPGMAVSYRSVVKTGQGE